MNIEIANRLVTLRKRNSLSQEALAEKLGISRQAVSKWERAEASPDTDNLILLSRIYGISMDELLSTEDEIPVSYMDMEEEKLPEKEIREEEGEILSPEKEPDEYVHIGGDECFKGFWHKCPRCQVRMKAENLKNEEELQSYFIHRMGDLLKSKGKKLVGWDEILEGGLAPDANVMSWRGMEGGIKAAKAGHHVIMTPTEHCYLDLWQGEPSVEPDTYSMCRLKDSYSFNPVPEGVPAEMVLGGQGNLWAESLPTFRHVEYMTWPRGWALSEVLWSGPSKTDWEKFWPRVEKHFVRADQADINYARSMYNAIVSPYLQDGVLQVELGSEIAGTDIYYTFDNTDPDSHTPKYTEPLSIPKNATWLRIVTYRDGKPVGKVITLTTKELAKRAESDKRTGHGNLTVD